MKRRAFAVATALIATVALAMPATGVAGKTKKVKVKDDFYTPTSLSIKKGKKVAFKWAKGNANPHNVKLRKAPSGVKLNKQPCSKSTGKITKCNYSQTGRSGINFTPTFNKKGTFKFHCTIHPTTMKMTVKVKK